MKQPLHSWVGVCWHGVKKGQEPVGLWGGSCCRASPVMGMWPNYLRSKAVANLPHDAELEVACGMQERRRWQQGPQGPRAKFVEFIL